MGLGDPVQAVAEFGRPSGFGRHQNDIGGLQAEEPGRRLPPHEQRGAARGVVDDKCCDRDHGLPAKHLHLHLIARLDACPASQHGADGRLAAVERLP